MSIALPDVDLSSATAGSTGTIDLTKVGVGAGGVSSNPSLLNKPATIFLFNESGCTLTITFAQTGNSFKMPSGAWVYVPLPAGEYQIKWSVDFLIPGAPITLLLSTYYAPGDNIPSNFTLGNSPIGGAVTTSGGGGTANQLLNVGNSAPTNVIDVQQSGSPSPNITADNSGNFSISQWVSSTLTQLFAIIAGAAVNTANVVLSDASHITQVNGLLQGLGGGYFQGISSGQAAVVQALSFNNQPIFEAFMNHNSTTAYWSQANNANTNQVGYVSNDGNHKAIGFQANSSHLVGFDYQGAVGDVAYRWNNGSIIAHNVETTIQSTNNIPLAINAPTSQWIDFQINAANILRIVAGGPTLQGATHYNAITGGFSRMTMGFAATVTTGTIITHGLGVTPSVVMLTPNNNATVYVSANGATTFTIIPSVNVNCWWLALTP